jgi:hypothetical protein
MKEKYFFTKVSIPLALSYWALECIIHYFGYGELKFELIPSDLDELWMRIVIVILLLCFGIYADKHTKSILDKEEEKRIVFEATVKSTHHILNNMLNQMQYFKMVADEKNAFDDETNELYKNTITEGKELIIKLSSVEELTEENIIDSVNPENGK